MLTEALCLPVCVCLQGGTDQKMPIIVSRVAPGTSVSQEPNLFIYLHDVHCIFFQQENKDPILFHTGVYLMKVSTLHLTFQADLCMPRLNEGDQVVQINGRDISDHTHDQVVMFIKASCESHSGELILLVRPNGK